MEKTDTIKESIYSTRLFKLAPDAFQHHQLEMVQRERLKVHIQSITPHNGLIVGWADYPENACIIDPLEQQSDYYDQYTCILNKKLLLSSFYSLTTIVKTSLTAFLFVLVGPRLCFLS